MAGNTLSQAERDRKASEEMDAAAGRIKEFATGVAKAVTTDLPGFLMDLGDKLSGKTSTLGERDNSSKLFEKLTGVKSTGSNAETVGGMFSPETAVKAMIVGAARLGKLKGFPHMPTVEDMIIDGERNSGLFNATGVYRDKDGSRKTILSDANAKLTTKVLAYPESTMQATRLGISGQSKLLPEVLDHPDLYALYPELRDTIVANASIPLNRAEFLRDKNKIRLGPQDSTDTLKSTLLHEIQHNIQKIENFQRGGNYNSFTKIPKGALPKILEVTKNTADPSIIDAGNRFRAAISKDRAQAYDTYMNLPGEKEARFTQATRNLTEEELGYKVLELLRKGETPGNIGVFNPNNP